jgi:signal peptidase I
LTDEWKARIPGERAKFMTTAILFGSLIVGLLFSIFSWGGFLWVGLRCIGVKKPGIWPTFKTALVVNLLQIPLVIAIEVLLIEFPAYETGIVLLNIFVFLIPCIVIKLCFGTTFGRATIAWLPTLLAPALIVAVGLFVFRGFLFQAFTTPSNSMAPTLLGEHWEAQCSVCGSPAYCSPRRQNETDDPRYVICRDHMHVTKTQEFVKKGNPSDRFYVAKFLTPKRWDLIAFENPADPSIVYLSRLVGLPGEEITIEDRQIHANGQPLILPESIRDIEYWADEKVRGRPLWGTREHPAKLGIDEYFVLGDFSVRSVDSRWWQTGAPGHPAYAVPATHIRGVVTHIFWPPSRLRVLR